MISNKRFSDPNPDVGNETEFFRCNFSQVSPIFNGQNWVGVPILTGQGSCTFIKCNLVNCEVPPGSIISGCNATIKRFKVEKAVDEIVIDGFSLGSTPFYVDIIYGIQTSPAFYDYYETPIEIENIKEDLE